MSASPRNQCRQYCQKEPLLLTTCVAAAADADRTGAAMTAHAKNNEKSRSPASREEALANRRMIVAVNRALRTSFKNDTIMNQNGISPFDGTKKRTGKLTIMYRNQLRVRDSRRADSRTASGAQNGEGST